MNLSKFKETLGRISSVNFIQPNGNFVPRHFHITEAGLTTKNFIDCGGTVRTEKVVNFQLWTSTDYDHRLDPRKLLSIISIYEKHFGSEDLEVEMEYQNETIGRYSVSFNGDHFELLPKHTDCLASDHCGITSSAGKLADLSPSGNVNANCCTPGGGCC